MRPRAFEPLRIGASMNARFLLLAACCTWSCATGGTTWMSQPLSTGAWAPDEPPPNGASVPELDQNGTPQALPVRSHKLGEPAANGTPEAPAPSSTSPTQAPA